MKKIWIIGATLILLGTLVICFLFTFFLEFTLALPLNSSKLNELEKRKNEVTQGIILGSLLIGIGSIINFISIKERF